MHSVFVPSLEEGGRTVPRVPMGKRYRLLDYFLGNLEIGYNSTGIGRSPSDFKLPSSLRELETSLSARVVRITVTEGRTTRRKFETCAPVSNAREVPECLRFCDRCFETFCATRFPCQRKFLPILKTFTEGKEYQTREIKTIKLALNVRRAKHFPINKVSISVYVCLSLESLSCHPSRNDLSHHRALELISPSYISFSAETLFEASIFLSLDLSRMRFLGNGNTAFERRCRRL